MKSCFEYEEIFIFEVTIINWSRVAEFARKAAFVFFLDLDPESKITRRPNNWILQTSHAWRIIAGVVVLGSIISWDWPPLRAARRATSSKWSPGCSELGPSSFIGCHPSGGDAGGDIKNCFSSFGGFFSNQELYSKFFSEILGILDSFLEKFSFCFGIIAAWMIGKEYSKSISMKIKQMKPYTRSTGLDRIFKFDTTTIKIRKIIKLCILE